MSSTRRDLINPVHVFFAIVIVAIVWFAPIASPIRDEKAVEPVEPAPLLALFASSADACPFKCVVCTAWDENAWPRHCAEYICDTSCEGDPGGGGTNQPPTISYNLTCTQPGNNGWCVGNLSLDLTASDPQGSQVMISGDVNGIAFTCLAGTTCSVPLPEGVGSANYRVDASSTGLFATGNATYLLDTSTPQLNGSASGVVGTNGWYKSDVTLSVTQSDTISGIASTTVTIDGGTQSTYSAPITVSDGIHTVTLSTIDNAGNIAQTTQTFYIDTITPVLDVSLSGSMGLNNWYISNVNVTPTASDTGSGVALLEASIDGSAFANYQAPITFSDGIHSYQFRATDNAGNITQTAVQQIKVDTTTPAISLKINGARGQNDWYVSDVTVMPTASDGGAGVGLLEALIGSSGSWTVVNAPLSFFDGIHDYQIRAKDNAGNETLIPIQQVKVDTMYPVIAMDDELKLGETLYYDLEDPVIRSAQVSGLWINRHVIQDDAEKYKKIAWQEDISGQKFQSDILWDGKFSDGVSAEVGEYFITLKISDAAGNETMQTAIIKVNALSFLQIIPPFSPPQTTTLPAQTLQTDSAAVTEFGGTNSGATGTESTSTTAGGTAAFNSDTDYIQSGFTQESQSTNFPISNSNVLWGAAATAMLGATLADWQRKREEEEARKRAEAASQEEGGGGSGKKTPGQIAYEKMMHQKHIVGESQALLNEKAKEKADQAEQARQSLIAKNEDKAPVDVAKVNQLLQAESARQALIAKNEDKAPVDVVRVQQLVAAKQEEENLSNIACVQPPPMCFAPDKEEPSHPDTFSDGVSAGWDALVGLRKMMAGLMLDGRPFRGGPEVKPLVNSGAVDGWALKIYKGLLGKEGGVLNELELNQGAVGKSISSLEDAGAIVAENGLKVTESTWITAGVVSFATNTYDYGWGEYKDKGWGSHEFVVSTVVDTAVSVGIGLAAVAIVAAVVTTAPVTLLGAAAVFGLTAVLGVGLGFAINIPVSLPGVSTPTSLPDTAKNLINTGIDNVQTWWQQNYGG